MSLLDDELKSRLDAYLARRPERRSYFSCQRCDRICDWTTRDPVADQAADVEVKSIGSRYCNASECIEAEAKAHGLPIERILAMRAH